MSMHFDKDNYRCSNCNAIFLPYKINFKCPNCGQSIPDSDTKEYIDSIEDIANSMEAHKLQYGQYFPGAWNVFNIMDHIQSIIFSIFDALESEKPENKEKFIKDSLENNFIWVKQIYLKDHIKEIAIGVLEFYEKGKFDEIPGKKVEDGKGIYIIEDLSETGYRESWFNDFFGGITDRIKRCIRILKLDKLEDDLYDEVKAYTIKRGKISTASIQRKFRVGYNRASDLIEMLERRGVIENVGSATPIRVLQDK